MIPEDQWKEEEMELFPPVQKENFYGRVIIVDNLPKVDRQKEQKLLTVASKIFGKCGTVKDIYMPFINTDGEEMSRGFAFIEYATEQEAQTAVNSLDGHTLDKQHIFKVNKFEDFDTYLNVPDEFKPQEEQKLEPQENLYDWLLEPNGCDQYLLRYGEETEIVWNAPPGGEPRSDFKMRISDKFVVWSPQGTWMATLHKMGIILSGGSKWQTKKRFKHAGVTLVQFSPCENYVITYSPQYAEKDDPQDPQAFIVWDVKTGQKMRGFVKITIPNQPKEEASVQKFPFVWSHNDKYFSRLHQGLIHVYETPSMALLNKRPIKLHGPTTDHTWSPADSIMAAFIPEHGNIPARVMLMKMPSQEVIGQQALYNVIGCFMHWHPQGHYLAVKVDRHKKSKKQQFTSFEFFRIREKLVPVENLELDESVVAFNFEPKGDRFAIIHGESPVSSVSFYSLADSKITKLATLEKRSSAGYLYWSPEGRYIVIAERSNQGKLEFYDAHDLEIISKDKAHPMVTNIDWDPTGRYVATYVSTWAGCKMENGYKIWSFRGTPLLSVNKDPFYQFIWRPRPPSLLTAEKQKDISENLDRYSHKYKEEDIEKAAARVAALQKHKDKLRSEFRSYMESKRKAWENDIEWRKSVGWVEDREEDFRIVEEEVEDVYEQIVE